MNMKFTHTTNKQAGAVSLFVVIFAMLLISVVTVGFLRIMTNDQNQATGNDLSQSAFDSSQAGVEDAKRALLWYSQSCLGTAPAANCVQFASNLDECNASIRLSGVIKATDIAGTAGGTGTGEIKVQQSTSVDASGASTDSALDQAYTCVTMQLNTDDYVGSLPANQSVFVPLVTTGNPTSVTIEWFSREDISNTTGSVKTPSTMGSQPLLRQADWETDRPSVMRTQFMQVGNTFKLTDFDATTSSSESNANTLFLYPSTSGATSVTMTDQDIRMSTSGNAIPAVEATTPYPIRCTTTVAAGGYACRVVVQLPTPVGGGDAEAAYLRLTSMYAASHFRVSLSGGLQFENVQPIVDATGRADDVFRRVQSRIDLYGTAFPYPDGAVDVMGDFCKDFGVTDTEYIAGSCTP